MQVRNITDQPLVLRLVAAFPPATAPGDVITIPAERAEAVLCQPWYWEAADDEAWQVVADHLAAVADANDTAIREWKKKPAAIRGEPPARVLTWWDHGQVDVIAAVGGTVAARQPTAMKES